MNSIKNGAFINNIQFKLQQVLQQVQLNTIFSLDTVSTQQQLNSTVNTHMFKLLSRDDEMMAQSPTTEYLSFKAIENLIPNIRTVYQAHHGRNCVFI